jgi:hypothetical protein
MKRKPILWVVTVVVILGVAYYFYAGSATPKGQPPLASLNSQNISGLKAAFNDSAAATRLLVMLSPT